MKKANKIFYAGVLIVVLAAFTTSCNQASEKNNSEAKEDNKGADSLSTDTLKKDNGINASNFSIAPIVNNYLALKNALVSDDGSAAATAGKELYSALNGVEMGSIPADKHKAYMDIAENAKENAEHIGDNAGKIDHQREHFASLSKDVNDLIALFGAPQKLYQDFCPMYNDNKGAIWISESKEIKNPFYGSKMLTCGSVKKVLDEKAP